MDKQRRRSERLERRKDKEDKRTPSRRARDSVGGVLGLTPTRPDGRNLQVARAVDVAAAAAARLDELETAGRSMRKRRTGKKSKNKYVGIDRTRTSYSPRSRDSMAIYAQTNEALDDDDDDDDDDVLGGMPPLDGSDEEAPHTDGENDVGFDSPDAKDDGGDGASVIATPGPLAEPNTDDKAFIRRPSESDSGNNTEDNLANDDDPDYDPAEDAGSDEDDEDERPRHIPVAAAKAEAERAARAACDAALQEARCTPTPAAAPTHNAANMPCAKQKKVQT